MKALIAFMIGLIFTVGGVFLFEKWCEKQVNENRFHGIEHMKVLTVDELKAKFKNGVFPDPPEQVSVEKRYFTPFNFSQQVIHDTHHFMNKDFHRDSHRHTMKTPDGKILAENDYFFDKYHRRPTPANQNKTKASHFITMFGDSNILGYGLPEDQTIANFMSMKLPQTKVYNYSGSGIYPYEIVSMTEKIDRTVEIPEKEGVALYFYMAYHMKRNMGSIQEIGQPWSQHRRAVDIDENGEFKVLGTFQEERPVWFWLTPHFRKSSIFRYMSWDLKPSDRDFRILTAMVKRMKKNLENAGIKKFYVVIHPVQHTKVTTQEWLAYLDKEKIPFIYLAHWEMEHLTEGPVTLVYDGHYSANANKVLADGLLRVLSPELRKVTP